MDAWGFSPLPKKPLIPLTTEFAFLKLRFIPLSTTLLLISLPLALMSTMVRDGSYQFFFHWWRGEGGFLPLPESLLSLPLPLQKASLMDIWIINFIRVIIIVSFVITVGFIDWYMDPYLYQSHYYCFLCHLIWSHWRRTKIHFFVFLRVHQIAPNSRTNTITISLLRSSEKKRIYVRVMPLALSSLSTQFNILTSTKDRTDLIEWNCRSFLVADSRV